MSKLIIVADASRARIFAAGKNLKELKELDDFIHAESRLKEEALGAEAPVKSAGQRGSLQPHTFPKEHEQEVFARQLGTHLKALHDRERYQELIIAAAPAFLGLLRKELPATINKLVTRTINKELTRMSRDEITGYLLEKE